MFYIDVTKVGTNIFHSYINDYGERCSERIKYQAKIFEYTNRKTEWTDIDGNYLEPHEVDNIINYSTKWRGTSNHKYAGDMADQYQFITEKYHGELQPDFNAIEKCFFDIETDSSGGFPDPEIASNRVLSISMYYSRAKKLIVLGSQEKYTGNPGYEFKYEYYPKEEDMLRRFWCMLGIDISMLVGWNIDGFDIPYLINRSANIGIDVQKYMPFQKIKKSFDKQSNSNVYSINGFVIYDLMNLYKNFSPTNEESYSLNYICRKYLGEGKVEYHKLYKSLDELYREDYDTFINYNIKDTMLMVDLDKKLGYIDLALTIAYKAKINPNDVYSTQKIWHGLIYNELLKKNVIIPALRDHEDRGSYEGAFVADPQRGMHEWVVTYDYSSLYPNIMISWNMSTLSLLPDNQMTNELKDLRSKVNVEYLLNNEPDYKPILEKNNVTMSANGMFFKKDKQDITCQILDSIYQQRMIFKAELDKLEGDKEAGRPYDDYKIEVLKNKVWSYKIMINSYYGCIGNKFFRFYNKDVAEAVTLTGQFLIRNVMNKFNEYSKKYFGKPMVVYGDTDSCYITVGHIIDAAKKNGMIKSDADIVPFILNLDKAKLTPFIDKNNENATDNLNVFKKTLKMEQEKICDKAIFMQKKKYILRNVAKNKRLLNKSGITYKGYEIVRSSTPEIIRDELKGMIEFIFNTGSEEKVLEKIIQMKEKFMKYEINQIAFPRGINDLKKSIDGNHYAKGTPIHVRAAILYNNLLKKLSKTNTKMKSLPSVMNKDKIKFIYLSMPNPIQENIIGWPNSYDLPEEFGLYEYIDRELQFEKSFLSPIHAVTNALNWNINIDNRLNVELF